jgi:hypothetical protein
VAPLLPVTAAALAALVAAPATAQVPGTLHRGYEYEEVASAFSLIAAEHRPGEAVVLPSNLRQFARVYGRRYDVTVDGILTPHPATEKCDPQILPWQLRDRARIWLIGGHKGRHEAAIRRGLIQHGQVAATWHWRRPS